MLQPENKSSRLLKAPSTGGIIAIVCCLVWPTLLVLSRQTKFGSVQEKVFEWLALVLSFPLALAPMLYPSLHDDYKLAILWVLMGMNSFIWGYSMEWLIRVIRRKRRQH